MCLDTCEWCGKTVYATAHQAIRGMQAMRKRHYLNLNIYKCGEHYHIGKRPVWMKRPRPHDNEEDTHAQP